ncbi:hypothetical protein SCHPADRAFT_939433 [Schizopora paradoxa]|uniref:Uncharacterized protein n=1 Tax=Schizopora paradoxa TaxID=27342 RepID=A0A0H2RRP2_9AGAM|nr:hypothetical protein SCHPADRAFT_939433 [Schizopora paradoxa]
MPRGRPAKYSNDDDRIAAIRGQKREWSHRNASILARRRRGRGDKHNTSPPPSVPSIETPAGGVNPSISRILAAIVEGNPDSPVEAILEHFNNGIDSSPDARKPARAIQHWQCVMLGLHARSWGQFVFNSLNIEDGIHLASLYRDFDLAQHAIETAENLVHSVATRAFDLDPSGRTGQHAEARIVSRQIGQASFILHELVCSRKSGLAYFRDLYSSLSYDFQSGCTK